MNMRKIGKKGNIVTDNLLGLILVGIGLILIVVAVYKFYETNVNQEAKTAKSFVDALVAKIDLLEDGESVNSTLRGGTEWILVSWNANDNERPDKCALSSCICLCPAPYPDSEHCQESGFCRPIDKDSIEVYTKPYSVSFENRDIIGTYSDSVKQGYYCIPIKDNLLELEISKEKDSLTISYSRADQSGQGAVIELSACKRRNL